MNTTETFDFKQTHLGHIPLSKIRENTDSLRHVIDKESEEYAQGADSVRKHGVMVPILVRPIKDPTSGEELFGMIDGLHRFNWAMDAGFETIPAQIGSLDEGNLLEAQIIANVHKIETKPVQYTKAIVRILGSNPLMTIRELGDRLSRGEKWIKDRLGLLKLTPEIQKMVDDGTLALTNAYALSKLPPEHQEDQLQNALSQPSAEFCPKADQLRKDIEKARREGRATETQQFVPSARLQKFAEIKAQLETVEHSPDDSGLLASARRNGIENVADAITFALSWVMHLDPDSVAADRAQWEKQKAEKAAAAAERQAKREAERAKKAQEADSKKVQELSAPPVPAGAVAL